MAHVAVGLSGTSLLLVALTGANPLLGLLALSSPRQALPKSGPNALPLPTIGPRSRLPVSAILGYCQLALPLLGAQALRLSFEAPDDVEGPGMAMMSENTYAGDLLRLT